MAASPPLTPASTTPTPPRGLNLTWNAALFKQWVSGPAAMAPGTRMAFSGIKDDQEIANLWAFVSQYKADGSKK